jgi:hypothetical protein
LKFLESWTEEPKTDRKREGTDTKRKKEKKQKKKKVTMMRYQW